LNLSTDLLRAVNSNLPLPGKTLWRSPRLAVALLAVPLLVLTACSPGDNTDNMESAQGEPADLTYANNLAVDLEQMQRSPSGLYIRETAPGTGEAAKPGDRVKVHYTGWLANGQQFDSSRSGEPIEFTLGTGEVIAGWDEGVAGMQVGGRRQLVIPPALGYGPMSPGGGIPPNATLVFEVELLGIGQ
jgi:FKBP-type peptidyl-prolyl cis-trans isomerase FkpA